MALYPPAIKKLIPPGPTDPRITARVAIMHIAVMIGSLYDYFKDRSGGVESHFYVFKNGAVEQYRDTAFQADANTDANDFAISIETEGMEHGEWTEAQLASIKALLVWLNKTHSIPLVKCPKWNGSGVGYHTQFEGQWDKRHATCPGPDRIKQFNNVLVPWMAAGGTEDDMFTDADRKLLTYVSAQIKATAQLVLNADTNDLTAADLVAVIPDSLAQQVVDVLSARLATSKVS